MNENADAVEQRFIDLETKVLHQELIIEDLHKVVLEQQEKLHQLDVTLNALVKRLRETGANEPEIGPHNEKPPHY